MKRRARRDLRAVAKRYARQRRAEGATNWEIARELHAGIYVDGDLVRPTAPHVLWTSLGVEQILEEE